MLSFDALHDLELAMTDDPRDGPEVLDEQIIYGFVQRHRASFNQIEACGSAGEKCQAEVDVLTVRVERSR